MTNAKRAWDYLKSKGFNDYACAGIIGNFDYESGINPCSLQDSCQSRIGLDDESYTALTDSGVYTKTQFVYDQAGYSLCQWTYWSRKKAFYEFAKSNGKSVGDLDNALNFFYKEISEQFPSVLRDLKNASSVREASDVMMLRYECPADTSVSAQIKRASYGQTYYTQFAAVGNTGGAKKMGYITTKKGVATQLSEHFNSTEFDCHGSGCCDETLINEVLLEYLEKIRMHFNVPVTLTSAYRCPTHNSSPTVGGATGSRHIKGDAADIVVKGVAPRTVAQYAESIGIKGIGLYETSKDGYFVHIDTRDYKSFWYGKACAARSTFGGVISDGATVTASEDKNQMLSIGSRGSAVLELQESLAILGYQIETDGIYGPKTQSTVRDYQSKNGLTVDGIAGTLTRKSITDAVSKKDATSDGYVVHVKASVLNIRKGPGTNYAIAGTIRDKGAYKISAESSGLGASKWGRLADGRGWISLDYCTS